MSLTAWPLVASLRMHQWSKNLLLFLPLLAAHRIKDLSAFCHSGMAFGSFCLCASAIYLMNDLIDIKSDRLHKEKRHRPLASGKLRIAHAIILVAFLVSTASFIVWNWLPRRFAFLVFGYFALSSLYSVFLKRRLLVDVFTLAALYTIRIFAGGAAVHIVISEWLMAFSMFFFLSLAFAKRFTEVQGYAFDGAERLPGRAYTRPDVDILRIVGPASGYLAIMVLALYVNSPEVQLLYPNPKALWLVCPIIGYWITRIWFLANRGSLHYDPVVFALRDPKSYFAGICCCFVVIFASIKGWPYL